MIKSYKKRLNEVKKELMEVEIIRPGKVKKQQNGKKMADYLSYTFAGKGRTEYIKAEFVDKVTKENQNYQKFKLLTEEWIGLSIKISRIEMGKKD